MKGKKVISKFWSKKYIYLIIPFFVSLILFLSSCSNPEKITLCYRMEKELYKSEGMRKVLFINLKAATPDDFKRVIHSYQKVVDLTSFKAETPLESDISDLAALAQLRMAELHIQQKELDLAIESFQKVLRNYPQSTSQNKNALLGLAKIYERRYEKEKAVQTYHQLLDNYPPLTKRNQPDPNLFAVPNHLIQLYSPGEEKTKREKEFEYAKKYFQNLIRSYPNTLVSFAASLSLARAYQIQKLWKESIATLETAQDSTGQIPGSVLLQIGNIYYDELKDEKNAILTFKRVINSSPDSSFKAEAQMKIGMIYFQKRDYPKAKEELSKVRKFYPTVSLFIATSQYLIAQIYEEGGEWERALNEYNWLMVNNPLTPEGLDAPLRIVSYYQKENPALTSESFEKGLKHYDELLNKYKDKPFVPLIENQKAKLYILQKDWDKAIASLQKISEKYPGTDAGLNALLNLWKIYQMELKDERKSKEIFARIESEYPGMIQDTLTRR